MTRGQKIATAFGRRDDRLKLIYLDRLCLRILEGDQNSYSTLATYDSHWYLDRREYSDLVAGKKFKLLRVQDVEGCRLEKLRKMSAVEIGNEQDGWERFTVYVKPDFIGSVPAWEIKLSSTGVRV